jgi:hypothetical protein
MQNWQLHIKNVLTISAVGTLLWIVPPANAQSAQDNNPPPTRSSDASQGELARFDQFLDSHRDVAEQLRRDPSLVNSSEYLQSHPDLQNYLQQHPGIRQQITDNPNAFMQRENRFDQREDARDQSRDGDRGRDGDRSELARFDQFLDSHRNVAQELRRDPSLVNSNQYLQNHPDLQTYLRQHPGIQQQITNNPNAFMQREERFDQREDARDGGDRNGNGDRDRRELANFDQFLDGHREVSEQLRKDPSLVKNQQFVQNHPALQTYLQQHPAVRQQLDQNPNAFMHQEDRYDQREDARNRTDNDTRQTPTDRDANRATDRDHDNRDADRDNHNTDRDRDNRQVARNQDDDRRTQSDRDANSNSDRDRDNRNADRDANGDRDANRDRSDARSDSRDTDRQVASANNDSDRDRDRSNNRQVGRDGDTSRGQLASFDQFLDHHREIAEQLHRDPSLVKNQQFVQNHPALQTYLQAHQGVREEITENPNAFMRQENNFDHREDTLGKDMDGKDSFREYLGGHSDVAKQLSKKPELANDQKFLQKHPDFQEYLKAHPAVQTQLTQNPTNFMKSMQQPSASATTTGTVKTTTPDPKPKQ